MRKNASYYKETFIDDGEVNMVRVLKILQQKNYQGVLIPDHAPKMNCLASWHAAVAFALGWMKAALKTPEQ